MKTPLLVPTLRLTVCSALALALPPDAPAGSQGPPLPTSVTAGASPTELPGAQARALEEARSTARQLGDELRSLLLSELNTRGFEGAVSVCADRAQARTEEIRRATGRDVRRVTLRPRNPVNTPDAWERQALESFDRLPAADRPGAERFEVLTDGNRRTLRYLKPLITGAACLACHGDPLAIPQEVRAVLDRRYPLDRATGFAEGDVRGAISVRMPLEGR